METFIFQIRQSRVVVESSLGKVAATRVFVTCVVEKADLKRFVAGSGYGEHELVYFPGKATDPIKFGHHVDSYAVCIGRIDYALKNQFFVTETETSEGLHDKPLHIQYGRTSRIDLKTEDKLVHFHIDRCFQNAYHPNKLR